MHGAFILNKDVCVAAVPKCGQHTLAAYSVGFIPENKIYNFDRRVAFIRDPLDRFLSAYFFILGWNKKLDGQHLDSYETFVDLALVSGDEHILPQTKQVNFEKYNEIYGFSDFSKLLGDIVDSIPVRENSSNRCDIDMSYRAEEVKLMYKDDFILIKEVANGLRS